MTFGHRTAGISGDPVRDQAVDRDDQLVQARSRLTGIAQLNAPFQKAPAVTRPAAVTELDQQWDQAAHEHPDPDAAPFFPTRE